MENRPRSITIIGWLFVVFGSITLLSGVLPFGDISFAQRVAELQSHWYVHLSRVLGIVAGAFMLKGYNWARWLLVAWMAFHIVVGALNGWFHLLTHVVSSLQFCILFFALDHPLTFGRTKFEDCTGLRNPLNLLP